MRLNQPEATLFAELKGRGGDSKQAIAELFHQARQAALDGKPMQAALHYAVLSRFMPRNQNLPMRAARSYHKAGRPEDAARWYLEAAERYAEMHQTTQAIATLRLYREVAPDEHNGPRRIFELCREKGYTASGLYEFLSPKEQAARRLRADDMFAAFDDATFESALDAMSSRKLQPGDTLTRTGEPASAMFIIVHGRLEGFLTLKGNRTRLGYLGDGDMCGATPYFTGGRHASEVVAVDHTTLLELPYQTLDELRRSSDEFRRQLDGLYRDHILIQQLALAPLFSKLGANTRARIARQMELVSVAAGEAIFREGENSCDVYLVRSGAVTINLDINGQERQFKSVTTGSLVGEINVATKGKRSATARAIADCRLAKLDGERYLQLYQESEPLQALLKQRIARQVRETGEFIRQLNIIDGGDTCELLLREIWSEPAGD